MGWRRIGYGWLRLRLVRCGVLMIGALALSSALQAQSLGGIHHYELVVLGDNEPSNACNIAYEISDCGLIVGQMMHADEGGSALLRAFVYSTRTRPGLPAGTVRFLPSAIPTAMPSIARDVNDDGWIVGHMGATESYPEALRRAVAWRLRTDGAITTRLIDPPSDAEFRPYGSGGYGWLAAVSTGETPWVTASFALLDTCSLSEPELIRERVVGLRLSEAPAPIKYRLLCPVWTAQDNFDGGRHDARGISPSGRLLCGSRESCGYEKLCGETSGYRATNWLRDWDECETCSLGLDSVNCRTPNPIDDLDFFRSAARQFAILDDSSAAGIVIDRWPEFLCGTESCGDRAYVWDPYDPCEFQCEPASESPPSSLGVALPLPLPIPPSPALHGSSALDFERSAFALEGIAAGHFVAGGVNHVADGGNDADATQGHLWFAPLGPSGSVLGATWSGYAVRDLISQLSPGFATIEILEMRGVNRRGDAVGSARLTPTESPGNPQVRAVFLRAVPSACVGDLTHDGVVGAEDLAILFGEWCESGGGWCEPNADLDIDETVGAPDLVLLLGNWGSTPCDGECAPDAIEVPIEPAEASKAAVDISIEFVGLTDIETYRAWTATASPELRQLVEAVMWTVSKGVLE